ncbi:MBL fold metallo-hydrolase [Lysobacter solisilvae (ex Woo and Kim 2020)]|nr:MBL fold metallo-hydrolase [Lysobacter terrestris]
MRHILHILATAMLTAGLSLFAAADVAAQANSNRVDAADAPYPGMPAIPAIGDRTARYMDIPEAAKGPDVDPAKGYRLQDFGGGLYMITDNVYQSMFLVYDKGVVVVDAPPLYAAKIQQGIAEVTDKPITHLIYSHAHKDHIGGAKAIGGNPVIIAHAETARLLKRAADPDRPVPSVTFQDKYTLNVGGKKLELSYFGNAHEPGNIYIRAPEQKVLMVVDVIFPGWMPWRRFAVAQDVPAVFAQVEDIRKMKGWDTLVGGHVARTGTRADVDVQAEFYADLKKAAGGALATTKLGEGMDPKDQTNPWALFDNYIDRVALQCVNTLTPKWATRLGGYDAWIWDQCFAMEQSMRIEEG